jgi:UDP-2,3-diacylglucosamine pyrophosphatase LpxH
MVQPRQIFVISDLHLGGPPGFQMMRHPEVLASFINELSIDSRRTELIIAGDFVDFLAEGTAPDGDIPSEWDPLLHDATVAVWVFERIARRPAFAPIFEALRGFLQNEAHSLTVLLGNHDIELSYPAVRKKLCEVLSVEEGRGLRFIYDGEAYVVGDALIEHGNRYDRWNQVDHDRLRHTRSLQSRGEEYLRSDLMTPPAGSQLVAFVMNPIKRVYGFVDLLKPENEAVLPILLALEPGYRHRIVQAMAALSPGLRHGMARDGLPVRLADAASDAEGLSLSLGGPRAAAPAESVAAALTKALGSSEAAAAFLGALPADGVRIGEASGGGGLRLVGALLDIVRKGEAPRERKQALVKALRALQHDRSWELTGEEETSPYLIKARQLAADGRFRYVVFGHTHHARRMTLPGGCTYFNSGTWAELMRVPDAIVRGDDAAALAAVEEFLQALDRNDLESFRWFRPTYVRMQLSPAGHISEAELLVRAA